MDKEQILALLPLPSHLARDANGVEFYDGFQMHQYAMKYADAVIASYKAELLKEVGEPVAWRWRVREYGDNKSQFCPDWGFTSSRQTVDEDDEPLYTSDKVAAAVLKATNPLEEEVERLKRDKWCPDVCPITGRPFFMWVEHFETGEMVPTYGGPFDSYTIPVKDDHGDYTCERYDHDRGGWLVDECEDVGVQIVDSQLYTSDDDPNELRAQLAAAQEDITEMRADHLKLVEENHALRDQLAKAEQRVAEWQPIETAPKDGSVVLIGRDMGDFGFVRGYGRFDGKPDSFVSGWISHGFNEIQGNLGLAHPTQWMPLPKAPNGASS